ncbi:MAG TPA: hypothetical protein VF828_01230 [Patescibacteria group bacterium]
MRSVRPVYNQWFDSGCVISENPKDWKVGDLVMVRSIMDKARHWTVCAGPKDNGKIALVLFPVTKGYEFGEGVIEIDPETKKDGSFFEAISAYNDITLTDDQYKEFKKAVEFVEKKKTK